MPTWLHFPSPNPSKTLQTSIKKWGQLGKVLTSILDPMLVPTWLHFPSQNPPKSLQKSILEGIIFWSIIALIFYRFWLDFPSQVGTQNPPKLLKNRCQDTFPNSFFDRFLEGFWWILEVKWKQPKSIKNRCQLRRAIFWKIVLSLQRGLDFSGSGGLSWG